MKITDILAGKEKKIITLDGYATVSQAVAEMVTADVGSVVVLLDGIVEGIFTERNVLKLWINYDTVKDEAVIKFMSTNLIVTTPDDTVENAMSVMSQKNIRHLLVIQGKTLIGILSIKDIIRAFAGNVSASVQYMEKLFL